MLKIKNLNVYYGSIHALKNVNLNVKHGEIVSLIGANGAGKTTLLHALSGLIKSQSGVIEFNKETLNAKTTRAIVLDGVIQVPEGRKVFSDMSVYENLLMGAYSRKQNTIKKDLEYVFEKFPRLKERKNQLAKTLSGGEQQMLAISRALMAHPKILLLDEPSMGLAPLLVKEIFNIIKELNNDGITILLIEQNVNVALSISHRAYVLENGKIVLEGNPLELMSNEDVKKAYLGG